MFGPKNSIKKDLDAFINENYLCSGNYPVDMTIQYASLIEARITNDLFFISNPSMCSRLGLDVNDLYKELEELTAIRQKITFNNQNKNQGFGR